ncbi:MAG: TusE/DsrC/DsvC family sulfur relay protein [Chromatiales bacterium]|jgi:tRNA 2-thiouridine synthesizing protein E
MADSMNEIMNPNIKNNDPDFPHAPQGWSKADAESKAREEGIDLSADHWDVIKALQSYFAHHEDDINVREIHDALDERFHGKGGMKFLYEILPGGPIAQGSRLAGLETPTSAVDKSFGSVQ